MSTCCAELPKKYEHHSIDKIPELANRCEGIETKTPTDSRYYRCRICGQLWEERKNYECAYGEWVDTVKIWSLPII